MFNAWPPWDADCSTWALHSLWSKLPTCFYLIYSVPHDNHGVVGSLLWWLPMILTSWFSCSCVVFFSWVWARLQNLWITNRIQQKWWTITYAISLWKSVTSVLEFPCSLSTACSVWWNQLPYYELPYVKAQVAGTWRQPQINSCQWSESCQQLASELGIGSYAIWTLR